MTKVVDLEAAELDYWVAKAEGLNVVLDIYAYDPTRSTGNQWSGGPFIYEFSRNWSAAGDVMEREHIGFFKSITEDGWIAFKDRFTEKEVVTSGPTPLIAAMRCYVESKYGKEVPDL